MTERAWKRVNELLDEYVDSDVCMYEMLADTMADGLTMEEAIEVYAYLMNKTDYDYIYRTNEEDGFTECITTGERWSEAIVFRPGM